MIELTFVAFVSFFAGCCWEWILNRGDKMAAWARGWSAAVDVMHKTGRVPSKTDQIVRCLGEQN